MSKKFLSVLLTLTIASVPLCVSAFAEESEATLTVVTENSGDQKIEACKTCAKEESEIVEPSTETEQFSERLCDDKEQPKKENLSPESCEDTVSANKEEIYPVKPITIADLSDEQLKQLLILQQAQTQAISNAVLERQKKEEMKIVANETFMQKCKRKGLAVLNGGFNGVVNSIPSALIMGSFSWFGNQGFKLPAARQLLAGALSGCTSGLFNLSQSPLVAVLSVASILFASVILPDSPIPLEKAVSNICKSHEGACIEALNKMKNATPAGARN